MICSDASYKKPGADIRPTTCSLQYFTFVQHQTFLFLCSTPDEIYWTLRVSHILYDIQKQPGNTILALHPIPATYSPLKRYLFNIKSTVKGTTTRSCTCSLLHLSLFHGHHFLSSGLVYFGARNIWAYMKIERVHCFFSSLLGNAHNSIARYTQEINKEAMNSCYYFRASSPVSLICIYP